MNVQWTLPPEPVGFILLIISVKMCSTISSEFRVSVSSINYLPILYKGILSKEADVATSVSIVYFRLQEQILRYARPLREQKCGVQPSGSASDDSYVT